MKNQNETLKLLNDVFVEKKATELLQYADKIYAKIVELDIYLASKYHFEIFGATTKKEIDDIYMKVFKQINLDALEQLDLISSISKIYYIDEIKRSKNTFEINEIIEKATMENGLLNTVFDSDMKTILDFLQGKYFLNKREAIKIYSYFIVGVEVSELVEYLEIFLETKCLEDHEKEAYIKKYLTWTKSKFVLYQLSELVKRIQSILGEDTTKIISQSFIYRLDFYGNVINEKIKLLSK